MTGLLRRGVFGKTDQGGMGRIGFRSDDECVGLSRRQGVAGDDEVVLRGAHDSNCVWRAVDGDLEALFFEDRFARVEEHLVGSDEQCGGRRGVWGEVLEHDSGFPCVR